jgi:uncharacterized protein YciI
LFVGAQDAEARLDAAVRDRQRHLAQLTSLRSALRALGSGRGDSAASVARLHEALDHAVAKEALARNALNRWVVGR